MSKTSDEIAPFLEAFFFDSLGDTHGVELFYNWQATPWLNVTPDLQVVVPARDNVNTALLFGVRAVMTL